MLTIWHFKHKLTIYLLPVWFVKDLTSLSEEPHCIEVKHGILYKYTHK